MLDQHAKALLRVLRVAHEEIDGRQNFLAYHKVGRLLSATVAVQQGDQVNEDIGFYEKRLDRFEQVWIGPVAAAAVGVLLRQKNSLEREPRPFSLVTAATADVG
jgi:hypothetical protein